MLLSCLALAAARPEAPGGYSYNRPSSGGSSGGGGGGGGYSNGGSSGKILWKFQKLQILGKVHKSL